LSHVPRALTTPLTITQTGILATIRGKEFMQYPSLMKNSSNTRNLNKFRLFHHDHWCETKECHTLKNEIKILIARDYLHQFMKKRPGNKSKEIWTLDVLPKIKYSSN
jgi:hypothetical protein